MKKGLYLSMAKEPKTKRDLNPKGKPTVEAHELISSAEVTMIREAIVQSHADLVIRGMLDKDVRKQLEKVVRKNFKSQTKGNDDVVRYIVRETIGTGVIEEILNDESITDIGYNGRELIIESNDNKQVFDSNFEITDDYIVRLVNKFANANGKDFTPKSPVFDGRFENVRINAVHRDITAPESGTTMSLRVVRPRLALTQDNFQGFAPMFVYDFLEAAALSRSNMVISGTTGTGKTELHKLISGFIPFDDRILLIEDTPETFMKEMFPEKDIYSWVTAPQAGVTELIKAGLRNNPTWIMVTETRGKEAYEMIQAVLSGHSIITSLHATQAKAIPSRFVNMAKMGYELSEEALIDDIRRYFQFGIHIKKVKYKGMVLRYLSEIVEFNPVEDHTVFKQRFVDGVFKFEVFDLTDEFKFAMEETSVDVAWPESFKSERPLHENDAMSFEATIPLDENGRPDQDKLDEMGTTVGILMGRESAPYDPGDRDLAIDYGTNKAGYIAPDLDNGVSDKNNKVKAKIDKLKREQERDRDREVAKAKRAKQAAKQSVERNDIDADVAHIIDSIRDKNAADQRIERRVPVPTGFADRYKDDGFSVDELSRAKDKLEVLPTAQDILAAKRKELNERE